MAKAKDDQVDVDALGVVRRHRYRMEHDKAYREAALSINPDGAGGAALGKFNASDAPTSLSADQD